MRAVHVLVVGALLAACKDSRPTAPAQPEAGPPSAATAPESTAPAPTPAATTPAGAADDIAIRRVFAEYREAIERGDGARATKLLDATTLAFYERMKQAALHMPGDEVRQQPLVERLTIVAMRLGRSRAQLAATSADELVATVIQGGGVSSVQGVELFQIAVDGDIAQATARKSGLVLPMAFVFRREPAGWRFDVGALIATANELLKTQLKGMSEDQLIRAYVTSTGAKADESIWEPPP